MIDRPAPSRAARLIVSYVHGTMIQLPFATVAAARDVAHAIDRAPDLSPPMNTLVVTHVGGKTNLYKLDEIVAVGVIDRVAEDDAEIADVPYAAARKREAELVDEDATAAARESVGVGR